MGQFIPSDKTRWRATIAAFRFRFLTAAGEQGERTGMDNDELRSARPNAGCGAGGFGNWASIIFMGEPRTLDDRPPRKVDFGGRTLGLIRLSGWAELTPSPDGNAYAYDLVWEFYGK